MTLPLASQKRDELHQRNVSRQDSVTALKQLSEEWLRQNREKLAIECLDEAMLILETDPCDSEREVLASLYHQVGHLWRQLGNNKLTGMYYQKALSLYRAVHQNELHYDVAASHFILASFLDQIWKLKPALSHYQSALRMMSAIKGESAQETNAIRERVAAVSQKIESK